MTPLEKIKEGILTNDMEEIVQGFMALTGEEIRPEGDPNPGPAKKPRTEEAVQPPVQVRAKDLDFSTKQNVPKGKKRVASKEPVKAGANTFVDDGEEHSDVTTPEFKPTPRQREPSQTVNVKCHVCEKDYEVSPVLAQGEFYRCDNCVGSK